MNEQRLIDLETKMAHQEFAIEELQRFTLEQAKAISALEKTLEVLVERVEAVVSGTNKIGPGNEKPPHY